MNWKIAFVALVGCASAPRPPAPVEAQAAPAGVSDRQLGISKTSVFEVAEPAAFAFPRDAPGGNDKFARSFPGAPPPVPHDVSGYLPITAGVNRCATCHNVEKAPGEFDPTPIPASHHVDWRNEPGVPHKEVAGARWVCTSCHVPQAPVHPPVGNLSASPPPR